MDSGVGFDLAANSAFPSFFSLSHLPSKDASANLCFFFPESSKLLPNSFQLQQLLKVLSYAIPGIIHLKVSFGPLYYAFSYSTNIICITRVAKTSKLLALLWILAYQIFSTFSLKCRSSLTAADGFHEQSHCPSAKPCFANHTPFGTTPLPYSPPKLCPPRPLAPIVCVCAGDAQNDVSSCSFLLPPTRQWHRASTIIILGPSHVAAFPHFHVLVPFARGLSSLLFPLSSLLNPLPTFPFCIHVVQRLGWPIKWIREPTSTDWADQRGKPPPNWICFDRNSLPLPTRQLHVRVRCACFSSAAQKCFSGFSGCSSEVMY